MAVRLAEKPVEPARKLFGTDGIRGVANVYPMTGEFHEVAGQPLHMAGPQESNEKVARVGLQALAQGKPRVISGTRNWLSVEAQRLAPRRLVTKVAARMFMPHQ